MTLGLVGNNVILVAAQKAEDLGSEAAAGVLLLLGAPKEHVGNFGMKENVTSIQQKENASLNILGPKTGRMNGCTRWLKFRGWE